MDAAKETGLDFEHFNGMSGALYACEVAGSGTAVFDYDNDGDLDVYLVQGSMLGPDKTPAQATFPPDPAVPLTDRLYRNDLGADGDPTLRFTDVTAEAGLSAIRYGMGVTAADYDDDGWIDLYVTNLGSNQLLHNNGDGTFSDVTAAAGVDDTRWSVSASFADLDRDGHLDLAVANYVEFSYAVHQQCRTPSGLPDYCGSLAFESSPDRLFRNRGDGTFEDITVRAGLDSAYGAGLGIIAADLNGDALPDLYVANDMMPNQLWTNQGDGRFLEDALLTGTSVNRDGLPEASMGVAVGDYDADGDADIFLTHIRGESNTLYQNQGGGLFHDRTAELGLDSPSWPYTAFGTGWFDYDNDGWLDLLIVNGAVRIIEQLRGPDNPYPLQQTNQLFRNQGDGTFAEVTDQAGVVFELAEVSRGAAFGDIDNDGDTDVLISNNTGPPRLLLNQIGADASWLGLRVLERSKRRDAIGATVSLAGTDGRRLLRQVRFDGSYASAVDPRVVLGLGTHTEPKTVEVLWPSGARERWSDLETNRYHELVEGEGQPVS